jgi:WD40 repeat protein
MADGSVMELSLVTGEDIGRINMHQSWVTNVTVSTSRDRVASCDDHEFRVVDKVTGASISQYRAPTHVLPVIKFIRDDRRLLTTELLESQWSAHIWDLGNATCASDLKGHGAVLGAEFLSDEELLTWDTDGKIYRSSLPTSGLLEVVSPAWSSASGNKHRAKSA